MIDEQAHAQDQGRYEYPPGPLHADLVGAAHGRTDGARVPLDEVAFDGEHPDAPGYRRRFDGSCQGERVELSPGAERALRRAIDKGFVKPTRKVSRLPTISTMALLSLGRRGFLDLALVVRWRPRFPGSPSWSFTAVVDRGTITELGRARLRGHDIALAARQTVREETST